MLPFQLLIPFIILPFAFTMPRHGPSTGPGYVVAKPLHQMEFNVYQGNASKPCQDFLALQYASPMPVNETACVAGISSAPPLHASTCVVRKKAVPQLDKCELWAIWIGIVSDCRSLLEDKIPVPHGFGRQRREKRATSGVSK